MTATSLNRPDVINTRNILTDEVIFSHNDGITQIKQIKVFRLIQALLDCDVKILRKTVFIEKDFWKVAILVKAVVSYIDCEENTKYVSRLVTLTKKVPFPLQERYEFIDCSQLPATIISASAECSEVTYNNFDFSGMITVEINAGFQLIVTDKKIIQVFIKAHDNKKY